MKRINGIILAISVFISSFAGFESYAAADDITIVFNNAPSYIMDKDEAGFSISFPSTEKDSEYTVSYEIDGVVYTDVINGVNNKSSIS